MLPLAAPVSGHYTWVKKEIAIIKHFRLEDSPAPSMPQTWPLEGVGVPASPLFLISLFLNCPLVGSQPREKQTAAGKPRSGSAEKVVAPGISSPPVTGAEFSRSSFSWSSGSRPPGATLNLHFSPRGGLLPVLSTLAVLRHPPPHC